MKAEGVRKKTIFHFIIAFIILLIFQQIASKVGSIIAQFFDYSKIDPDNTFAYISIHHIVQMIISIIVIYVIYKVAHLDFNLKWNYSKVGIKYTAIFTSVILIYVIASYIIGYKINSISPYGYPLNAINVFGTLGFQLLLSGPSEEILFRALPIAILLNLNNCDEHRNMFLSIICSAFLFSLAHINWMLSPFSLTINLFQLIYAFVLGVAYGVTYIKTKSIIYPMIMHSISNVLMVGIGYLFM